MTEAMLGQLAMSVFNLFCVIIFGKHLLKKFEDMGEDIHEIKTDVAVLKKERELERELLDGCSVRKNNMM